MAQWLLSTSEPAHKRSHVTDELREVAAAGVALVERGSESATPGTLTPPVGANREDLEVERFPVLGGDGADIPAEPSKAVTTAYTGDVWYRCYPGDNFFSANANVFNRPEHVERNNCYCFASNHLAGERYALPGRRGGRPATRPWTCCLSGRPGCSPTAGSSAVS